MMMKPNAALLILAVSFLSSQYLVKAYDDAVPKLSPKLRGTTALEAPEKEEDQQHRDLQGTLMCYKADDDGKMRQASCSSVGVCDSYACCTSMSSCFGQGQRWCGGDGSFASGLAIEYVNEATCPYQWSCCY